MSGPATVSSEERCPKCETPVAIAGGIGPYCPNKDCDVIDNLKQAPAPALRSSKELVATLNEIAVRALAVGPRDHNITLDEIRAISKAAELLAALEPPAVRHLLRENGQPSGVVIVGEASATQPPSAEDTARLDFLDAQRKWGDGFAVMDLDSGDVYVRPWRYANQSGKWPARLIAPSIRAVIDAEMARHSLTKGAGNG
jgi:hypothetical protein